MSSLIHAADLFCGAGGFSSGLRRACHRLGLDVSLLAINHWDVAIATHSSNHPDAMHLCESLHSVDPRKVIKDGRLNLLLASPECTHHSNARGGKPMNDQSRSSAMIILDWCDAITIDSLLIENVREFADWGPLYAADHPNQKKRNRPIESKKGSLFRHFLQGLRLRGYKVDYRILNAADYGDATTRYRLFIQARRGRTPITWPEPTHTPAGESNLFGDSQPWRSAREIIDWDLPGKSIYGRKKPLSENTMRRILAGLKKFSGLDPYIIGMEHFDGKGERVYDPSRPLPTITSKGQFGLYEPYIVVLRNNCDARSIDQPLPALCANGGHVGVAEPYLVKFYGGHDSASLDEPLPTITANYEHYGLAQPFIVPNFGEREGQSPRCHSIEEPLPTVTGHGAGCLVQPFIVQYNEGESRRCKSIEDPLPTITAEPRFGLAEPYLVQYNGTGGAQSVSDPLNTVTSRDRFGLACPEIVNDGTVALVDIKFRMLQPHELAAAMGFPADYAFTGVRDDKVKQIGNAVPVNLAAALCEAMLST